ncbi:MAG: hypothetical protein AVDCRST_MAG05-527, partial [uncultured Rubrobacteraceae bacterium]
AQARPRGPLRAGLRHGRRRLRRRRLLRPRGPRGARRVRPRGVRLPLPVPVLHARPALSLRLRQRRDDGGPLRRSGARSGGRRGAGPRRPPYARHGGGAVL